MNRWPVKKSTPTSILRSDVSLMTKSGNILNSSPQDPSHQGLLSTDNLSELRTNSLPPLNDRQTADLAFTFCFIWFIANWSVNASLGYTSVASATILSSMSGNYILSVI